MDKSKANLLIIKGDTFSKTPTWRNASTKQPVDLGAGTISLMFDELE